MLFTLQGIVTGRHSLGSWMLLHPRRCTMGMLECRGALALRLNVNACVRYTGWKYSVFHPTCLCFFMSVLLCDLSDFGDLHM